VTSDVEVILTNTDRLITVTIRCVIAATLMARYRIDELKSADVSLLIGLLGKTRLFA
jgi:hypothetical protein